MRDIIIIIVICKSKVLIALLGQNPLIKSAYVLVQIFLGNLRIQITLIFSSPICRAFMIYE